MRAALVLSVSLALALLAVPGALAERAFSDPAGDAGAAPDITAVRVSHDVAGVVSMAVTTNQQSLSPDATFWGFIDADRNPATGMSIRGLGADEVFFGDGTGGVLFHVDGDRLFFDFSSSFSSSHANETFVARFNRTELGTTEQFVFGLEAELEDANGDSIASDYAPDTPTGFEYSFLPLVLTLAPVSATPRVPVAGKPLTLATRVTRSDGEPFASGSVVCKARVGSTVVRATPRISGDTARCSLRVPAAARGKQLRGSISVTADGSVPATRPFVLRVRA